MKNRWVEYGLCLNCRVDCTSCLRFRGWEGVPITLPLQWMNKICLVRDYQMIPGNNP